MMHSMRLWLCLSSRAASMSTYAFLFPGQGSQFVGMTEALSDSQGAVAIFQTAQRVLGYDLQAVCRAGPRSLLDETVHCQPAVMAASLAALASLRESNPEMVSRCRAAAGFSVGEVTALTFAGALSIEEGFKLIQTRANAMQTACLEQKGSMLTVIGLSEEIMQQMCTDVTQTLAKDVCIANFIFPKGYVISGTIDAVEEVGRRAGEAGATTKPVAVSGAFHSPLMQPAVATLEALLAELHISTPRIPVYSNINGRPYGSVEEIRRGLALQVTQPVLWNQLVQVMIQGHVGTQFVEVGPGKQLRAMLRRINVEAFKQAQSVAV